MLTFSLVVNDDGEASTADTVTITVRPPGIDLMPSFASTTIADQT